MTSFFRYPGGKQKFKDKILSEIKTSEQYREPFFGGGSIGLNVLNNNDCLIGEYNFKSFWINDKDIGIYSLWTSVLNHPDTLKEMIRCYKPSVDDFDQFKNYFLENPNPTDDEIVECGFRKLVLHQISYSGLGIKSGGPLGGREQKSNYKIDCRWSPESICKKIDKINRAMGKVSIKITSLDFNDIIADDNDKSFIYLDPPYYDKGGDLYHHSFTVSDHERMSKLLRETSHSWLLSYDDCEEIRELYSWAKIETIDAVYTIQQSAGKSNKKSELLIRP